MIFLLAGPARAEEPVSVASASDTETETEAQLRERIRALEARLDAVEASSRSTGTIPVDFSTHVHGFASLDTELHLTEPVSFVLGDVVLTYDANVADRARLDLGIAYRPDESGLAGVGIEQVQLTLGVSSAFELAVGEFPDPLTTWRSLGFRGDYRYTPIGLPVVLGAEDEDGPLPMHQIGILGSWSLNPGLWQLGGDVAVTNGRNPLLDGIPQEGDSGWWKSVAVTAWTETPGGVNLHVGGSVDRIDTASVPADAPPPVLLSPITEGIGELGVTYATQRVELRGEHFVFLHDGDAPTTFGQAGYLLVGPRLGRSLPFAMAEWIDLPSDPIFDAGEPRTQTRGALGVRLDPWLHVCLKASVNISYAHIVGEPDGAIEPGAHFTVATGF